MITYLLLRKSARGAPSRVQRSVIVSSSSRLSVWQSQRARWLWNSKRSAAAYEIRACDLAASSAVNRLRTLTILLRLLKHTVCTLGTVLRDQGNCGNVWVPEKRIGASDGLTTAGNGFLDQGGRLLRFPAGLLQVPEAGPFLPNLISCPTAQLPCFHSIRGYLKDRMGDCYMGEAEED